MMVRPARFELAHPSALPPQSSVSTVPPRSHVYYKEQKSGASPPEIITLDLRKERLAR